jgi:hypothetical protein
VDHPGRLGGAVHRLPLADALIRRSAGKYDERSGKALKNVST